MSDVTHYLADEVVRLTELLVVERAHADEAVRLLSVVIDINPEMQEKVRKFVAEHEPDDE